MQLTGESVDFRAAAIDDDPVPTRRAN